MSSSLFCLARVQPECAAHWKAEWGLRGPDPRSHRPLLAHTRKPGQPPTRRSVCLSASAHACLCVFVCVCRVNTNHPSFTSLCLCLRLCYCLLVFPHPPQGTARTAAVPMTTLVLLSINRAALSSLACILYIQLP